MDCETQKIKGFRKTSDYVYPFNLLFRLGFDEQFLENIDTIPDLNGSLQYALYLLSDKERKVLLYRYKDALKLSEIGEMLGISQQRASEIELHALGKLLHPTRLKYIKYGVMGVITKNNDKNNDKIKRLETILSETVELKDKFGIINIAKKDYLSDEIKTVGLSTKTYRSLLYAGVHTMSQLSQLTFDEICDISRIGQKGVGEIVSKLNEYGYVVKNN